MDQGLPRAALALHQSTSPNSRLTSMPWELIYLVLGNSSVNPSPDFTEMDLFVLLVNAQMGISPEMVELWNQVQERQIPRILLVQDLESGDIDFDDISLIAARILEPIATPFLVIHSENGSPIGLISLDNLQLHDYSNGQLSKAEPDQELVTLVRDFRQEYQDEFLTLGDGAFENGLYALAIPISESAGFGFAELTELLLKVPKR